MLSWIRKSYNNTKYNTKLVFMSLGAIILVRVVAATVAWAIFAVSHTIRTIRNQGPEHGPTGVHGAAL